MRERVKIVAETVLAERWGVLRSTELQLQRRDGSWQKQVRETYDRGDGASILLFNRERGTVILTRQFRFPVYAHGDPDPFLVEVCAGKLDGDDPETCARKEAEEETGYRVGRIEKVAECFSSPGSVTEKLHLFVGEYEPDARVSSGGGLEDEGEDIEVLELPLSEALNMLRRGEIADAKTIILLQHAALHSLG